MESYFVNTQAQANGDHEVHKSGCNYMPLPGNQKYLGAYLSCKQAVPHRLRSFY
ncbi:hypothetical protein [Prolixibacter sp. SD074]|uniref:hypothetical protein n=1 Tax=Prolixibacter sp. SD074 TaxID=2652391 RepID=UPI00188E6495|nr:hypothetical protein [Prolixibacter sp. SD074]